MSNKTQLQTNNTSLDGYIARINAAKEVAASLPEAGGSGGGSVETCIVRLSFTDFMSHDPPGCTIYCTFLDSTGVINSVGVTNTDFNGIDVDNVLIGSIVYVVMTSSVNSISFHGEGELLHSSSDKTTFVIRVDAPHPESNKFTIAPSDI